MKKPLSLHQLAHELEVPRDWLRDLADAGRIPCLKVAGLYLFDPDAVQTAICDIAAVSRVDHGSRPREVAHA